MLHICRSAGFWDCSSVRQWQGSLRLAQHIVRGEAAAGFIAISSPNMSLGVMAHGSCSKMKGSKFCRVIASYIIKINNEWAHYCSLRILLSETPWGSFSYRPYIMRPAPPTQRIFCPGEIKEWRKYPLNWPVMFICTYVQQVLNIFHLMDKNRLNDIINRIHAGFLQPGVISRVIYRPWSAGCAVHRRLLLSA